MSGDGDLVPECVPIELRSFFPRHHSFGQGTSYWYLVGLRALMKARQLLAFATDELSMRVGQTLAGLMNATLVRFADLHLFASY